MVAGRRGQIFGKVKCCMLGDEGGALVLRDEGGALVLGDEGGAIGKSSVE